mgnify:CR=1 FL=1
MNVLEELIYYCKEYQPTGALMLTGEWGCGKTYLIENELKNSLKDSHVLIRISLFGLESINDVKLEIKKSWFNVYINQIAPINIEKKRSYNIAKRAKSVMNAALELLPEPFKSFLAGTLSINFLDFVDVKPEINKKKVILIFDDLERCNISTSDLLGCINDYCENLHISTIIVANEDKISNDRNDKIQYNEIKEKIVHRTINYAPDYASIISNIIDDLPYNNDELKGYRDFLMSNKKLLAQLFSSKEIDEVKFDNIGRSFYGLANKELDNLSNYKNKILPLIKNKPHNIRSFKCAIHDFKRIYILLKEKEFDNIENYLFSYVSYFLSFRTNVIYNSVNHNYTNFGTIVSIMYPMFFNDKYISKGIIDWIEIGTWNKETINGDLDYHCERDKALTSEEKMRYFRLTDLEEKDVEKGFPKLIEKSYEGELELNDYVVMICNSKLARDLKLKLPKIDWIRVKEGVNIKFDKMIASNEKKRLSNTVIDIESKESYTSEEWETYELIYNFRKNDVLTLNGDKNYYLNELSQNPKETLLNARGMRFNTFDNILANTTFEVFKNLTNMDKHDFVACFDDLWNTIISRDEFIIKDEDNGFLTLKNMLTELSNKYEKESLPICKNHTDDFIIVVDHLIEKQQQKQAINK